MPRRLSAFMGGTRRASLPGAARGMTLGALAARRLSRLSAIAVSFLSVAFSSSRVCYSTHAQSFCPRS
jgi:hypothetical protein